MTSNNIIILVAIFGAALLALIFLAVMISGKKKAIVTEAKPIIIEQKPVEVVEENFEEIAAIIAAIEAFRGGSGGFKLRRIIRQQNGSQLWNRAGVEQNNSAQL